jgi:hypothetical protein
MRSLIKICALTSIIAVIVTVPSSAQKTTGPKAQYAMDVSTMSGFGAGMGGSLTGGIGAIFGGGGGGPHYMLDLHLKSTVPAAVQPEKGEHFFLAAVKLGKSVPLLGGEPSQSKPRDDRYDPGKTPEKPKGRLLMFWGCNVKAPKGQPFIIDFAKLPNATMPPMGFPGRDVVRSGRDANTAWWPNSKNGKQPKSGSSLIGEHRVTSNFTPEIKFNLANDYMGALTVNTGDQNGAISLNWNNLSKATGYVAWAVGGMQNAGSGGDMVMWTSSESRDYFAGLDWLPPAEVQRKIGQKLVLPPSQTNCSIPAEAKTAARGTMFGNLNAFGPEENFAFPAKPADPKAVWNIEWTTKARFRSFTTFLTGEDFGGLGSGTGGNSGTPPPPEKKKSCKGPFGVPIPGTKC